MVEDILHVKDELYIKKNEIGAELAEKIKYLSIAKQPLTLSFTGKLNEPLCLTMTIGDNDKVHRLQTTSSLKLASESGIAQAILEKRFKNIASNNYRIEGFEYNGLADGLTLPFKELTVLKTRRLHY